MKRYGSYECRNLYTTELCTYPPKHRRGNVTVQTLPRFGVYARAR